jgi:polyadenylate-binding protein 2
MEAKSAPAKMSDEDDVAKFQRLQKAHSDGTSKATDTVYVKNLDDSVTNADIVAHFRSCGAIVSVNVLGGRGARKYAIVDFGSDRAADISTSLNGSVLKGKKIVVQKKRDFNKRS